MSQKLALKKPGSNRSAMDVRPSIASGSSANLVMVWRVEVGDSNLCYPRARDALSSRPAKTGGYHGKGRDYACGLAGAIEGGQVRQLKTLLAEVLRRTARRRVGPRWPCPSVGDQLPAERCKCGWTVMRGSRDPGGAGTVQCWLGKTVGQIKRRPALHSRPSVPVLCFLALPICYQGNW